MAEPRAIRRFLEEAADIYTLGVMLYELLVLERPFGGSSMEAMASHMREEPVPPPQRAPGRNVPLELEAVCLQALRKAPDERFASAEQMLVAVQTWAEAESDKQKRNELAEAKAAEGACRPTTTVVMHGGSKVKVASNSRPNLPAPRCRSTSWSKRASCWRSVARHW